MWYDMTWCDMMWWDVMWCVVMCCDVLWCVVMCCDVLWCVVIGSSNFIWRADAERCLAVAFTTSTSLQVFPTQHFSLLNSDLYKKSQVVPWTFRHYNQSELHTIHQVLLNMIRVKEKRDLASILNYAASIFDQCFFYSILQCFLLQKIGILGTTQAVNIIKELWTVFDEPIALLCKVANLGQHLERMLKAIKAIVKVCSIFPFYLLFFHFILFHGSGI